MITPQQSEEASRHNRYYQYLLDRPRSQKFAAGGVLLSAVCAIVIGVTYWYVYVKCKYHSDDEIDQCTEKHCASLSKMEYLNGVLDRYKDTKTEADYLAMCGVFRGMIDCMHNECLKYNCNEEKLKKSTDAYEKMQKMDLADFCAYYLFPHGTLSEGSPSTQVLASQQGASTDPLTARATKLGRDLASQAATS